MKSKKITKIILLILLFVMASTVVITPVHASTNNAAFDVAFDAKYYLENNSDLKAAFGEDYNLAHWHFINYGIKEGRVTSPQFDVRYYLENSSDLKAAFGNNYEAAFYHFVNWGIKEGRITSPKFDVRHYLANNSDLKAAYGNDYKAAHTHYAYWGVNEGRIVTREAHVYGEAVVTKEATCAEPGEKTYTCTVCGNVKTEEIPTVAHDLTKTEATEETCTEDGNIAYWTCNECGKIFSDEAGTEEITLEDTVVPAAHSFTKRVQLTEPTCTEDGSYIMVCDRDGCEAVEQELDENGNLVNKVYADGKLGHNFATKSVITEATCTEDGTYVMVCDRDGCEVVEQELDENGNLVNQIYTEPAKGHSFVKDENGEDKVWRKEATCTEDGFELRACEVCGETISTVLQATGHSYGEPEFTWNDDNTATAKVVCANDENHVVNIDDVKVTSETTPATCEEAGKTVYTATATFDGTEYTSEKEVEIPAIGHTWGEATLTDAENGDKISTKTCETCGETETETVHTNLVTYKVLKEATCDEEGSEAQICLNCKETVVTTIPKLPHELTKTEAKAATCEEDGNIAYWTCDNCEKIFSDENGTTEITAEETVIDATGHTLTKIDAVAATCDTPGNIDYWTCDVCGKIFSDENGTTEITAEDTVIPAGHTLTATEAKDATCEADGNIAYWTCDDCGKIFSDAEGTTEVNTVVVPATGHTLTKTAEKPKTCTEDGNIAYWTCDNCGKIFSDEAGTTEITKEETVMPTTGHALTNHPKVDPTDCTTPGNIEYWTCSDCGKIFSDAEGKTEITIEETVIPAKHTLTATVAKAPTCEEDGNIAYWTCDDCGKIFSDAEGKTEVDTVVVPATGHTWEVVGKKAACEYAVLTCTNKDCKYYGQEISAEKLIEDGIMTQDAAEKAGYVPTCEHSITTIIIKPATAEYDGIATDHCSICGKDIRVKYTIKYEPPVITPGE